MSFISLWFLCLGYNDKMPDVRNVHTAIYVIKSVVKSQRICMSDTSKMNLGRLLARSFGIRNIKHSIEIWKSKEQDLCVTIWIGLDLKFLATEKFCYSYFLKCEFPLFSEYTCLVRRIIITQVWNLNKILVAFFYHSPFIVCVNYIYILLLFHLHFLTAWKFLPAVWHFVRKSLQDTEWYS